MNDEPVVVSLTRLDWGQVIDGLCVRVEAWRKTEKYLNHEEVDGETEECSGADEARHLADTYERIVFHIQRSLSRCV